MRTATLRHLRLLTTLLTAFALLTLAAGCQSARPMPMAYQVRLAEPLVPPAPPTPTLPPTTPIPAAKPLVINAPLRPRAKVRAPKPAAVAKAPKVIRKPLPQQLARTVQRLAPRPAAVPSNTTEVGLGTTVLGVLGLIVAPIALIGLLIWGGLAWSILLGLAALAILIAYLDPFW